jgi:hypothetical protein
MKKFFTFLILGFLLVVGFGCQSNNGVKIPSGWITFKSSDYGFSLAYPDNMEMRGRSVERQSSSYIGLSGNFFASLRDVKRESKPVSLAVFYSFKDISTDKFIDSLKTSDPDNITIKETIDLSQGGLSIKKIINTTALGTDKVHYVFQNDGNLIVVSVFIGEENNFTPVLATMQVLTK